MSSLTQEIKENPMLKLKVEKVVVNIGVGKSGEPLEKAKTVLSMITGVKKVSERNARKTIKEFGIRKKEPIAAVVTLRGSSAKEFLSKAFSAIGKKVKFGLTKLLKPQGFNFGINMGEASGQSIEHIHFHLIPRYFGDTKFLDGGIRKVTMDFIDFEVKNLKEIWIKNRLTDDEIKILKEYLNEYVI